VPIIGAVEAKHNDEMLSIELHKTARIGELIEGGYSPEEIALVLEIDIAIVKAYQDVEDKPAVSEHQISITYPDGATYKGGFLDLKHHGYGVWTSALGHTYEGDWRQGKKHGEGKYTQPDGSYYVGDFVNNNFNGRGVVTYSAGNFYTGEFRDDLKHGQGVEAWPNGAKLKAVWDSGLPSRDIEVSHPSGLVMKLEDGLEATRLFAAFQS
jgi:hypothetical protein